MQEFIGVDLGSNSLRGVRMQILKEGGILSDFKILSEFDATVRTAEGLEKSGEICKNALDRILKGLESLKESLKITKDDKIIALTTQAMRVAKNSDKILSEIYKKSGISFKIISGEQEAKITALAPKMALKLESPFLLIDMGGASSEFILIDKEKEVAKSFSIGIVSAKDRYKSVENLRENRAEFLAPIIDFIKTSEIKPNILVANSGTPTLISALKLGLKTYQANKVFNTHLTKDDFFKTQDKFNALSELEKVRLVGEFKADVLPFGVELFTSFMESLGFEKCVVVDLGLREGAVLAEVLGELF